MMTNRSQAVIAGALLLMLTACGSKPTTAQIPDQTHASHEGGVEAESAEALPPKPIEITLIGTKGKPIGTAELSMTAEGTKVSLQASGLTPGPHGIHFHEFGKCEAPDFKTAGSHLNPFSRMHGLDNPAGPHAGDLPNIVVQADGKVKTEFVTSRVTLDRVMTNGLLRDGGTSLVIHEGKDDQHTDPAGNSGARVACGVIHQ
jgi:Cu-Zn family superoxide dismutase